MPARYDLFRSLSQAGTSLQLFSSGFRALPIKKKTIPEEPPELQALESIPFLNPLFSFFASRFLRAVLVLAIGL